MEFSVVPATDPILYAHPLFIVNNMSLGFCEARAMNSSMYRVPQRLGYAIVRGFLTGQLRSETRGILSNGLVLCCSPAVLSARKSACAHTLHAPRDTLQALCVCAWTETQLGPIVLNMYDEGRVGLTLTTCCTSRGTTAPTRILYLSAVRFTIHARARRETTCRPCVQTPHQNRFRVPPTMTNWRDLLLEIYT